MIGFAGRLQWRQHKLFKLCARLVQRENVMNYRMLPSTGFAARNRKPHSKFAIRSILVRRTKIEQRLSRVS
jgi:hypothetical protein